MSPWRAGTPARHASIPVHGPRRDGHTWRLLDDEVWRYLPRAPIPAVLVGVVGLALLVAVSTFSGRGAARAAAVLAAVTVGAILVITPTGGATSGRPAFARAWASDASSATTTRPLAW
ncbi:MULTISPECIES: hypothetical protein [unclassified Nocardioides]|uniref:hypothetical protein n=1 Tax=unclassified Nocardioides TaxID=2615069 RepID=UPI0030152082